MALASLRLTRTTTAALDLAQANGHTNDYLPAMPYAMAAQLFLGDGTGKLRDVSSKAGAPWNVFRLARGLATGDFDNDGRVDLLIVAENAPLALFHNGVSEQTGSARISPGHFVTILLEGTGSNRDGVGARGLDGLGENTSARAYRWRQLPFRKRRTASLRPGQGREGRSHRREMGHGTC